MKRIISKRLNFILIFVILFVSVSFVSVRAQTRKQALALEMMVKIGDLARSMDSGDNLVDIYFDRGYNSGGSDAIADGDITSYGITAAQLGLAITLFQNLNKFAHNDTPAQGDYDTTINQVRNDL